MECIGSLGPGNGTDNRPSQTAGLPFSTPNICAIQRSGHGGDDCGGDSFRLHERLPQGARRRPGSCGQLRSARDHRRSRAGSGDGRYFLSSSFGASRIHRSRPRTRRPGPPRGTGEPARILPESRRTLPGSITSPFGRGSGPFYAQVDLMLAAFRHRGSGRRVLDADRQILQDHRTGRRDDEAPQAEQPPVAGNILSGRTAPRETTDGRRPCGCAWSMPG